MAWYDVYETDVLGKPGAARYKQRAHPVEPPPPTRQTDSGKPWPPPHTEPIERPRPTWTGRRIIICDTLMTAIYRTLTVLTPPWGH